MLIERIRADLTAATKERDVQRQRTLRSAIAAVQEAQVAGDAATTLDDEQVEAVLASQVKRRADAAQAFDEGGAPDRAADERAEIAILEQYLPTPLTADELDAIVTEVFAANDFGSMADMGPAMKAVNARVSGRADGRAVADLVRSRLG